MGQYRPVNTAPELPSLAPGVTLLATADPGPLQSLVLDHLLVADGDAAWVDSHGAATTTRLTRLAPSRRLLDRVDVARGFTAYQHYSLVEELAAHAGEAALAIVPNVDWHYRTDDLRGTEGAVMLEHVATRLDAITTEHDIPVLVTREHADAFSRPIEDVADTRLTCERTSFGPRFVGDDFETLVYPHGDGTVQTTLAFWAHVLEHRAAAANATETETEVTGVGAH